MEKSTKQTMWAVGVSLAVIVGFAINTGPDEEESFKVVGTVAELEDNSIGLKEVELRSGNSDAATAFKDGEETIYDEYRDANCVRHETTTDLESLIASGQLVIGQVVTIAGHTGSSQINCLVEGFSKGSFFDTDHSTMTSIQLGDVT